MPLKSTEAIDTGIVLIYNRIMSSKTEISTNSVGERLRELRSRLKKTQAEMGRILGLKRSSFGKYETMENFPSLKLLHSLATRFNVSLDYLICGRGTLFYGKDETDPGRKTVKGELEELLDLMDRVPLVHHSILSYFQKLKLENKELIDKYLSETQEQPGH